MIYIFAIVFSILFILFILNLVRNNKLDEKYSILWLVFSVIILLIAIFPDSIIKVSEVFDVKYPPVLLLFFGMLVVGIYIVHITIVVTKYNKMIVKLTQETAILKEQLDEKNRK